MNVGDQLVRIRRFLRDPNGSIWGRSFLLNLFNDAQKEIQIKTGYLEEVAVLTIPPFYQWSYMFDWETNFMDGSKHFQCLSMNDQGDFAFCHLFEPQLYYYALSSDAQDWGAHFTHPWEAWAGLGSGEVVKIPFPTNFHSVQFLAYDREPLYAVSKKAIVNKDTDYVIHEGEPRWYWREDDLDNSFVPYPRPSTVVFTDITEQSDPDFIYTHDWEEDEAESLGSVGANWTRTDANEDREHVFLWESSYGGTVEETGMRGMFLFEASFSSAGQAGSVIYETSDDTNDAFGTFNVRTGSIFNQEEGIAVEVLDDQNNCLLVYDVTPDDVAFDADVSDFPRFLRKYIEHKVISRAYGANTDGRIQSLSDYWNYRHEVGVQMIKKFMSKRKADRDYRLITAPRDPRRTNRHPRLPSAYPSI